MDSRLDVLPVWLTRIETMAERLKRYAPLFDDETRADVVYILRYAAECRCRIELELKDRRSS